VNVLFLVPEFPSTSQTFVFSQIAGLLDRKVEVTVLALGAPRRSVDHHLSLGREISRRTIYLDPPGGRLGRAAKVMGSTLLHPERGASEVGHRIRTTTRDALKKAWPWPSRFVRLAGLASMLSHDMGRKRFDAAVCHFGPMGLIGVKLRKAGLLKAPLITAFHGVDMTAYLRQFGRDAYAELFKEGTLFLPVSDCWRRRLIDLECPADRVVVHHMGIDLRRFDAPPRLRHEGEPLRLLSIARLVEKKGIEYGIRAVAKVLRDTKQPILYTVIGDGPLRTALEKLARDLGTQTQVRFLGVQSQDVIATEFQRTHLMLAPSVVAEDGDEEGIPVALMEAMASGLPVVATRHSGIPELVRDPETGWLVPERDSEALAQAIKLAAASDGHWVRMGGAARREIEENFNIDRLNDRLLGLLRDASMRTPSLEDGR